MSIALLAPVPEEHLLSGKEVCAQHGKVAYGSRHWELFYQLQSILGKDGCEVLIYVSDAAQPINPPTVTRRATYLGFTKAKVVPIRLA